MNVGRFSWLLKYVALQPPVGNAGPRTRSGRGRPCALPALLPACPDHSLLLPRCTESRFSGWESESIKNDQRRDLFTYVWSAEREDWVGREGEEMLQLPENLSFPAAARWGLGIRPAEGRGNESAPALQSRQVTAFRSSSSPWVCYHLFLSTGL